MSSLGRSGRMVRAAFHESPGRLVVGAADLPPPGAGEVTLRVDACGICATNLNGWRREPAGPSAAPGAHGHEIAGTVEQVGPAVTGFAPGDRVCVDPAVACGCGGCDTCHAGNPMLCRAQTMLPIWGFADAIVVPGRSLVSLPDELAPVIACLAEPLASAVHGLRHSHRAGVTGCIDGERVVVLGGGTLGLLALHAARTLGAVSVTAVVRYDHQARLAEALGADPVIASGGEGLVDALRRLRPGLVVEAVGGSGATVAQALSVVDRGGEVVVLGLFDAPQVVDVSAAVMRNVRVFFSAAYAARDGRSDMAVAVGLLAAAPHLGDLVTHTFSLGEIADAHRTALERARGTGRVVVVPCMSTKRLVHNNATAC